MTVTIRVEEEDPLAGRIRSVEKQLDGIEIDYANFDLVCFTLGKLREQLENDLAKNT